MKFQATILALAFAANVKADDICKAKCGIENGEKVCRYSVNRDIFAGELGYYTMKGEEECGVNPTLGMEKGVTYIFEQFNVNNWYHALGFAYEVDGALNPAGADELEPSINKGTGNCQATDSCPAPMYILEGDDFPGYLGSYSNNEAIAPETSGDDDFGLGEYEPLFFYPLLDWIDLGKFSVSLFVPTDYDYDEDFFYFCHIHAGMSGRIKFIDSDGMPINEADTPPIPDNNPFYPNGGYQVTDAYDAKCGTFGISDYQLPNSQCPPKFVCGELPSGPDGVFADCIDSMNCAMLVDMTTNYPADDPLALFSHQMIPHHKNAVNMCKSLLKTGAADCPDIADGLPGSDDEPDASFDPCILNALCLEIINVQNAQIQTMYGVLDNIEDQGPIDCVVPYGSGSSSYSKSSKATKKAKASKTTKKGKGAGSGSGSSSDDVPAPAPTPEETSPSDDVPAPAPTPVETSPSDDAPSDDTPPQPTEDDD